MEDAVVQKWKKVLSEGPMECPNYVDPEVCAILLANQENLERSRKCNAPSTFRQMIARNFHRRRKR